MIIDRPWEVPHTGPARVWFPARAQATSSPGGWNRKVQLPRSSTCHLDLALFGPEARTVASSVATEGTPLPNGLGIAGMGDDSSCSRLPARTRAPGRRRPLAVPTGPATLPNNARRAPHAALHRSSGPHRHLGHQHRLPLFAARRARAICRARQDLQHVRRHHERTMMHVALTPGDATVRRHRGRFRVPRKPLRHRRLPPARPRPQSPGGLPAPPRGRRAGRGGRG